MRPKLEAYLASIKEYTPNRLRISDEHALENHRWRWYLDRIGYQEGACDGVASNRRHRERPRCRAPEPQSSANPPQCWL